MRSKPLRCGSEGDRKFRGRAFRNRAFGNRLAAGAAGGRRPETGREGTDPLAVNFRMRIVFRDMKRMEPLYVTVQPVGLAEREDGQEGPIPQSTALPKRWNRLPGAGRSRCPLNRISPEPLPFVPDRQEEQEEEAVSGSEEPEIPGGSEEPDTLTGSEQPESLAGPERPAARPASDRGPISRRQPLPPEPPQIRRERTGRRRPRERSPARPKTPPRPYQFPPLSLLKRAENKNGLDAARELKNTAAKLQQTLATFGVKVTITDISQGPAVTRYELQPEQGVKVSKIVGLSDDIKLNLAATDIRIEAPIPGKAAIGIEVPNKENTVVGLRELLESKTFREFPSKLAFAVGKDIAGKVVVSDIAKCRTC